MKNYDPEKKRRSEGTTLVPLHDWAYWFTTDPSLRCRYPAAATVLVLSQDPQRISLLSLGRLARQVDKLRPARPAMTGPAVAPKGP